MFKLALEDIKDDIEGEEDDNDDNDDN